MPDEQELARRQSPPGAPPDVDLGHAARFDPDRLYLTDNAPQIKDVRSTTMTARR
jgi:hypothetical protein